MAALFSQLGSIFSHGVYSLEFLRSAVRESYMNSRQSSKVRHPGMDTLKAGNTPHHKPKITGPHELV